MGVLAVTLRTSAALKEKLKAGRHGSRRLGKCTFSQKWGLNFESESLWLEKQASAAARSAMGVASQQLANVMRAQHNDNRGSIERDTHLQDVAEVEEHVWKQLVKETKQLESKTQKWPHMNRTFLIHYRLHLI